MPDQKFTFTITLNEIQLETLQRMAKYANFHDADVVLRKDGLEHRFEADWLRDVLKQVKAQKPLVKGDKVRHKGTGKEGVVVQVSSPDRVFTLVTIDGDDVKMLTKNLDLIIETNIRVNGASVIVNRPEISYRDIVDIAYGQDCQVLMTVAFQSGDRMLSGCIAPGESAPVSEGMIISAYHTGNA